MPYPAQFDHATAVQAAHATLAAIDLYKKPAAPNEKIAGFTAVKTLHDSPGGKGTALGWIGEGGGTALVAFRGTKNGKDVLTDLRIFKKANPKFYASIATHLGFLDQYLTVADEVRKTVAALAAAGKAKRVLVCGHSMGGALASLCALDLRAEDHKDVHMYNFGAPRMFSDAATAKLFTAVVPKSFRTVDPEDPVPQAAFGCVHFEQAWTPAKTPGKKGVDAHAMKNYAELVTIGKGT